MSRPPPYYVEVCHCSHDRDSHFERRDTCLGRGCDCRLYVHRDDPDKAERHPKPAPKAPSTDPLDDDGAFPTPAYPWGPFGPWRKP